jgi:uncharacterized protein (DUF2236 family)
MPIKALPGAADGSENGVLMGTTTAQPSMAGPTVSVEQLSYDLISGPAVAMLGGANVIMQLARRPVGRGVTESPVESGSLTQHPLKRTRTSLGYIAIALFGSDEERAAYRREIDRVHRLVRSGPTSEVAYNAFDPELQLWVAACMYFGLDQIADLYYQHRPEVTDVGARESLYQFCSRLCTTLQVSREMWPPDRAAFQDYWTAGLQRIEMDDITRQYLYRFASLRFLGAPMAWALGPTHRFIIAGVLPAPIRDELGLPWSRRRQRVHHAIIHLTVIINRALPAPLRRFPFNFYLWDVRRRIRASKPIL